jgi:hypothetical protein
MRVESLRSEEKNLRGWRLAEWNCALYSHFFAIRSRDDITALTRLYVTAEDLRAASGFLCAAKEARSAFVATMRNALGSRSLGTDASHRCKQWNPQSSVIPPFLSHLVFTCMVANDLTEELRSVGNFRDRLALILGTPSQSGLEHLRPLWEELAAWSVNRNLADAGCKTLRLPRIPDSGYHSIIGYSIRLAIPSKRDQANLAVLLRQSHLDGGEPELDAVLRVISANLGKFSSGFGDVFNDFTSRLRHEASSVLFHSTFWTAVREVALAGLKRSNRQAASVRVRLELEDDDSAFWLALTSNKEVDSAEAKSISSARTSQSVFQFILTDRDGNSLVGLLFSARRAEQKSEKLFSHIRTLMADGLLLFEESDDHIFVLSDELPAGGRICALVSERVRFIFQRAVEFVGGDAEITKSAYSGWSECRGLSVEALRRLDFSRFPTLAGIRSLRLTITPPEIRLREGIRVGSSFVAVIGGLPEAEVAGAERVVVELCKGEWQPLQRLTATQDVWVFAPTLKPAQLLGSHRIVAFAESVPIAEREIHFIETAFTADYKQPLDPTRWLVETMGIDFVSYSADPGYITTIEEKNSSSQLHKGPNVDNDHTEISGVPEATSLLRLMTSLCCRLPAQRGIPEGELVSLMTGEFRIEVPEIWPILRSWVEAGMLEVLTDARWRARMYFGRKPQLFVHQRSSHFEASLIGLLPPFLLERFDRLLSSASGLTRVERRSLSAFTPALPSCRSFDLELLTGFASELNLPPLLRLRLPEGFMRPVRTLVEQHTATSHDSWPLFRQWDWQRRSFSEKPAQKTLSGVSLDWCRREDGPDRYKLYRNGSLLWWTRSRTWALLAAFTIAGEPIFDRTLGSAIESQGNGLWLPLPLARFVCWTGAINSGPVTLAGGKRAYRYTFCDERTRESVLAKLWPEGAAMEPLPKAIAQRLIALLRTSRGPVTPIPASLRSAVRNFFQRQALPVPQFLPMSALPYLYAVFDASGKGGS